MGELEQIFGQILGPEAGDKRVKTENILDSFNCLNCGPQPKPTGCPQVLYSAPFCPKCADRGDWEKYIQLACLQAPTTQKQIRAKLQAVLNTCTRLMACEPSAVFPTTEPPPALMVFRYTTSKLDEGISKRYIRSCLYHWNTFNMARGAQNMFEQAAIAQMMQHLLPKNKDK